MAQTAHYHQVAAHLLPYDFYTNHKSLMRL